MDGSGGNPGSYNDALSRARQIAAKLSANAPGDGPPPAMPMGGGGSGNPNMVPLGLKRDFDEPGPPAKKQMIEMDPVTAQLRAIADQQQANASDPAAAAKAAAAQVAAKLNQNLAAANAGGMMGGGPMGMPMSIPGMGAPSGGMSMTMNEDYSIPDRMVGLVIGKGGEQITRLQAESGCKVQIAPNAGEGQDRACTLSGSPESISRVKALIQEIIVKAKSAGTAESVPCGQNLVEMLIPGAKVGLIIGKGGETIRMLQESTGCKMVMIQDTSAPGDSDKPLRITGAVAAAEEARRRVQELLDSKDSMPPSGGGGGGGFGNDFGNSGLYQQELVAPRTCVGIIIGKGGEMIKRIQGDYSVRVQFRPDDGGPERKCQVTGSPEAVHKAVAHIQGLIQEADQQDAMGGPGGGRGRGRGMPMQGGRGGMGGSGGRGGGMGGGFGGNTTSNMIVPAGKCGLIIGKGGETIREIVNMSGAHVELQRTPGTNPDEKTFEIRGNPDNIQHAMSLIADKAGIPPPSGGGMGGPPGGGPPGGAPGWGGPPAGGPGGPGGQWGQGGPGFGGQQQQPPQQQPQQPGWNQYGSGGGGGGGGGYGQGGWQGQQQPPQQQQGPPGQGQPPASQPGAPGGGQDPWSQYYQQYYQQQQQQQQQPYPQAAAAPAAVPAASNGAQAPAPAAAGQPAAGGAQPAASLNPQTGQADYSEAWAQYYRSMGYHDQADAILSGQGGAGGAQPGAVPQ